MKEMTKGERRKACKKLEVEKQDKTFKNSINETGEKNRIRK
jgi:hypothetical protein